MIRLLSALAVACFFSLAAPGCSSPLPGEFGMPRVEFHDGSRIADFTKTESVLAYYLPRERLIVLNEAFDATSDRDLSILLHEFVHFLQDLSGKRYPCVADMEREAYAVQFAFLKERGHEEPEAVIGTNLLYVMMRYMCGGGQ